MVKKESTKKQKAEKLGEKPSGKPKRELKLAGGKGKTVKGIVRICGRDINGALEFNKAIEYIQGVGSTLASVISGVIAKELNIGLKTQIGDLTEQQIEKVEHMIRNPQEYNIPPYLLNRRKDPEDGKYVHLIGNDLALKLRGDVQREISARSWRGTRHQTRKGKVRGQRTRSTGRGGLAVGVIRRAIRAKMGAGVEKAAEASKVKEKGKGKKK